MKTEPYVEYDRGEDMEENGMPLEGDIVSHGDRISIQIPIERYEELMSAEKTLNALYGAGIDNWDGYAAAMEAGYNDFYDRD